MKGFAVLAGVVALAGCRGRAAAENVRPVPSVVAAVAVASPSFVTVSSAIAALDLRVEARRGVVARPDAILERNRPRLEAHFGTPVPYPLAFQVASVDDGRAAVLLQATRGDAHPLVWLLDGQGTVIWSKEHPVGGVNPGVMEPTLVPGPDGHVGLAWCNGSTDSVAFRRWADDGGAFADYDALHVDACQTLSVLYWPRRGWVLAVGYPGGATLQLLNENGERTWGSDGVALPWTWPTAAPPSFGLDTPDSLMMFRLGESGAPGSPGYVFASRWSPDGRPVWPGPLSLVRLPGKTLDPLARVVVDPTTDGNLRASLSAAATGGRSVAVEIASDGTVTRR